MNILARSAVCPPQARALPLLACLGCGLSAAEDAPILANLSFEELSQIRIVSLSKWDEKASEAAAAVHVITNDDIRRSGARSLAEALRLAPGVDVARINAQRYAVSIRGFNDEFADKLLVLQDGRSLYAPQFSGTFWDTQDTFLDDVDRIEVIRGPGGTTWGANAVNGVVNILTKDARDTLGTLVTGGGGTSERGFGGVRQGGKLGENTFYRVYAQAFYRGETDWASGTGAGDDWYQTRVGFRADSHPSEQDHVTVQGEGYGGELLQYANRAPDDFVAAGGHLLARWNHSFSEDNEVKAQLYYDVVRRESLPATANTDTLDFEADHRFALGSRQQVSWGVHYRYLVNEAHGSGGHNYDPERRTLNVAGLFVEDQVTVVPDRLRASVGAKFEYTTFSDWEILPNARLSYTFSTQGTLWAAISRGVQTPSISDHDLTHNLTLPNGVRFQSLPNPDSPPGEVLAYEAGVRAQLFKSLSVDVACFYNDYDDLDTLESRFEPAPPTMIVTPSNAMYGETYGLETALVWQATDWWRWRAHYTLLFMQLHLEPGTTDTTAERQEGYSPQNQVMLWSSMDLGRQWEFDAIGRFVDVLPARGIDEYFSLDLRLAYHPLPNLEFALVGQNLLAEAHAEFRRSPGFPQDAEIPRGAYAKVTWGF